MSQSIRTAYANPSQSIRYGFPEADADAKGSRASFVTTHTMYRPSGAAIPASSSPRGGRNVPSTAAGRARRNSMVTAQRVSRLAMGAIREIPPK